MVRRLILLLILGALLSINAQDQRMVDANAAYETGDYQTAIMLYEALLADGVRDSAVYFNLGNAYYEIGQVGNALVNYRRAQQINPRDEQINANITLIRAVRADFQGSDTHWIDSFAASSYAILTLQELGLLSLVLWSAFFVGLSLRFLRYAWLTRPLIIIGIIAMLIVPFFLSRAYADTYRPPAVVTVLSSPVHSGPGNDYLVMYELFSAAEIRILASQGDWIRFTQPDGREGWLLRAAVTLIHE